ncbi:MAG: hypothetical protein GWM98_20030, partial [Nitrospinaceae bacterium]|nr:hypothetical protein [Nitrospinaceae bacterium]NIR55396.1 hypothetical protein [Nitrospinaceae bacterium]NIS85834.1 hypothetical protein [Nitrospinaceae bacterium]NIT83648.1 hypothetical protein [Nitrospinaceae bacterium]NIU44890.1 hypothetical protein [Nitrospinaceae bacterium]
THVNTLFYGTLGPAIHKHFQTFASLDHRLAHALARDHWTQARTREGRSQIVHEWGVGNGNLAGCFLTHLQEIDTEHGVYPRTQYVLCDYSEEILRGARENPRLKPHTGRFSPVRVDVGQLDCFLPNSVDRILSNEIWDDMATRVLLKHDGLLYEEYLQPYLDPQ